MKCYQPDVHFASEIGDNNTGVHVRMTLNLTRGTTFPVTTMGVNYNTLIDTSATKSCISETFYNQLMLPWLLKAFHLVVTSAPGSTLCPMGIVQCPFQLEGYSFEFNFIVCQNLTRPMILSLNFM